MSNETPHPTTDTDAVELSSTVNVTGLAPPRKVWVQGLARRTERRFVRAFGGDTDDVSDTNTTFPPALLESVSLKHSVDTSDLSDAETQSVREIADSLSELFAAEARTYREEHV